MDKPRHPQVTRPWKMQSTQKSKFQAPSKLDPRRTHENKSRTYQFRFKPHGA
ncbi:MAG TPA: hypothetical protein VEI54_10010 [Candidatus Limnocylindrales bacterium]|nr:hypothetical protein [Candidatus Limnocylindrales bacterium]